ncbi:MAG: serine O-acetyltransferase [Thiotrichales bacterium]
MTSPDSDTHNNAPIGWLARMREDVQCVFGRDPAARNAFEVVTTYPGVWAVWLHRLAHVAWNSGLKWLARALSNLARWITGIEIHPGARIGRRFFIDHGMGVVIGETAEIGADCTLYHGVTLGGTSWNKGKRHPTLQQNVVVGAGAKILGPIEIGAGARIGSNAVVLRNVPDGATVVGIPGHVVGSHTHETESRQRAFAEKIGFDAYGTSKDMPDPVADAFRGLIEHIHAMDERLEQLSQVVHRMGGQVPETKLPEIQRVDEVLDLDAQISRKD